MSWQTVEHQLLSLPPTIALFIDLASIKFITSTQTRVFRKSSKEVDGIHLVRLNDTAYAIRTRTVANMPSVVDQPTTSDPEVTIAVPLDPKVMAETSLSGFLFAYLPTLYVPQLPFFVNADFVIPASRERVELSNKWNERLMLEACGMFAELYLDVLQDDRIPLATLFRMLPRRTAPEVLRFAAIIQKCLREKPTVFCTDAIFRAPAECKIADVHIRALLDEELRRGDDPLPSIFCNLHFVAVSLTETPENMDYLTDYFGVAQWTSDDWVKLLSNSKQHLPELIASRDDAWIAQFLRMMASLVYVICEA
jgi:hypothetical protein